MKRRCLPWQDTAAGGLLATAAAVGHRDEVDDVGGIGGVQNSRLIVEYVKSPILA